MYNYLAATKRKDIGDFARSYAHELRPDEGCEYDQLIEINLSELERKCIRPLLKVHHI